MMTQKERNQEAYMGASWATRVNNGGCLRASLCDVVDRPHGIYLTSKKSVDCMPCSCHLNPLSFIGCNVFKKNLFLRHSVPKILTIGRQLLKNNCSKYTFGSKLLCLRYVCQCKMSRRAFRRLKAGQDL